jgi:mRNA-degrading endonuclease RelE of RelBE toxin-antitoxin system
VKVILDPMQAAPALRTSPPEVKKQLRAALRLLAKDPSGISTKLDVTRLDTEPGQPMYRLRVGDWRIAFTVDQDIVVLRVFHRTEKYGWLADMD